MDLISAQQSLGGDMDVIFFLIYAFIVISRLHFGASGGRLKEVKVLL